jgi:hypothetical protein
MININKIVIALCEGPHDTAFLYRVLRSDCYQLFSDKIDKLPNVVTQFIKQGYRKIDTLETLKLDALRNYNIPNKILYKDDVLVLLYAMGGDSEKMENSKRLTLINEYTSTLSLTNNKEFNPLDEDGFSTKQIEYSFLFFYDADEDANKQIKKSNSYLKELKIDGELEHNQYIKNENINYGCFIFSENGESGALENIMFGLIETEENQILLNDAKKYFEHSRNNRYKKKRSINYSDNPCEEISKKKKQAKLYEKKSILGIMGQLQNSGSSNVVTIEHSDYIKLEKDNIPNSIQEIIEFFHNA